MSIEKTALLKQLQSIKYRGPEYEYFGICYNAYSEECTGSPSYRAITWMSSTWPKTTGSREYPVKHDGGPLWDNPERWELLDHCIAFLEKELTNKS